MPSRSERRRLRAVLMSFIQKVATSPLGEVELDAEPAIRDFILDSMLKSTGLATSMRAVLEVAELEEKEMKEMQLDVLKDNIKALFTGKLPRRKNRTVLHEAAREGAERLVELTMVVWTRVAESGDLEDGGRKRTGSTLSSQARRSSVLRASAAAAKSGLVSWDGKDDDGKTALWHASYAGHDGVVDLLMASGADAGLRPKLTQPTLVVMQGAVEVEASEGRFESKGPEGTEVDSNETAFVLGIPSAAVGGSGFLNARPGQTCFVYEVEVEHRFVGNKAHLHAGWASMVENSAYAVARGGDECDFYDDRSPATRRTRTCRASRACSTRTTPRSRSGG